MKQLVTLKLNKEFKRAYYRGFYKAHPYLVTYLVFNGKGIVRIGITTGKKVGNAVCRSRARRLIRSAYTQVRDEIGFKKGVDLVFVARDKTTQITSTELAKIMKRQLLFLNQSASAPKKAKKQEVKKQEAKQ